MGERETQEGKQNTTFLQVKVLMPIILLLTSIFELFRNGSVFLNFDM